MIFKNRALGEPPGWGWVNVHVEAFAYNGISPHGSGGDGSGIFLQVLQLLQIFGQFAIAHKPLGAIRACGPHRWKERTESKRHSATTDRIL